MQISCGHNYCCVLDNEGLLLQNKPDLRSWYNLDLLYLQDL